MNGIGYAVRERRTPTDGHIEYDYGNSNRGRARWQDVSRTGAQVRLGQYLVPGRLIRLSFRSPVREHVRTEVVAKVTWCRRLPGTAEFVAGLTITRNEPEAALAFSALRTSNYFGMEKVGLPRWKTFEVDGEPERCVNGRTALQHAV